ncbi:MAG: LacI family DNA-binding transcriptional regulator [Cyclobacteriaceae bacterium]|nr:LacI family DNA-binding transcriptional regulator [Cyclobacteriaceae bacterium]
MAGKKTRVTIHDIARELNVTASTVSRALQDHPRIGTGTREAVKSLAAKYNYSRNTLASGLRTGRMNTIGVIVPRTNRHFFSNVIGGIESFVSEKGFQVLISQTHESYQKEVSSIKAMVDAYVDGLILSVSLETRDDTHLQLAIDHKIPVVMFDRVIGTGHQVVLDDYAGASNAVTHLLGLGCERIAHFGGPTHLNVYNDRLRGYIDALKAGNKPIKLEWIKNDVLTEDAGYAACESLFHSDNAPDAIFAASDYSALGALLWLKENGYKIPEEVCIMGFSNEPFTAFLFHHPFQQ